jgi:hypothetical protein
MHNYLVGQIIIIVVPSSLEVKVLFYKYWFRIGIKYANVFPLPVAALIMQFLFAKR